MESGSNPPFYNGAATRQTSGGWSSTKSKALLCYAVGVTVALVIVIIISSVHQRQTTNVLLASIKKYTVMDMSGTTPMREDIEIDMSKNFALFYLSGDGMMDGTFVVLDYTRSMTGLYEPNSRRCYLGGGLHSDIYDLQTLGSMLEKNTTQQKTEETFSYQLGNNFPVSDKTILPDPMKTVCMSLPIYWLEPVPPTSHNIMKRASFNIGIPIGRFRLSFTIRF